MVEEPPVVNDGILARIVRVRDPIRPELPPEGLIALTPNLIRAAILLAFIIGVAVVLVRISHSYLPTLRRGF